MRVGKGNDSTHLSTAHTAERNSPLAGVWGFFMVISELSTGQHRRQQRDNTECT
jgi:hypothetical protein